jgi:hypothetical protein
MPRVWLHRVRDKLRPGRCMDILVLKVTQKRESNKEPAGLSLLPEIEADDRTLRPIAEKL